MSSATENSVPESLDTQLLGILQQIEREGSAAELSRSISLAHRAVDRLSERMQELNTTRAMERQEEDRQWFNAALDARWAQCPGVTPSFEESAAHLTFLGYDHATAGIAAMGFLRDRGLR